ncbi:MAG: thiamine pyrophosphate-dependent enzyme [Candidatus Dormibacteraeota bacterium]|nr:thiamine pyrophosphate-dependent enzyme [Candidatus Dormibacteraeota bacterium]
MGGARLKRLDCLKAIYPALDDCAVVTIMGAVAAELYSLGHRANFFYLEHAMGLASSVGLGIALAQPDRKVVVIDGDGSVLMNLGGLTTMARSNPNNLVHLVFDNETLLSVGGGAPGGYRWFTTATSTGTDLAAVASAAGFPHSQLVRELDDFEEAALDAIQGDELSCIVAKVDAEMPASFLMDVHMLENRFEFPRALQQPPRKTKDLERPTRVRRTQETNIPALKSREE